MSDMVTSMLNDYQQVRISQLFVFACWLDSGRMAPDVEEYRWDEYYGEVTQGALITLIPCPCLGWYTCGFPHRGEYAQRSARIWWTTRISSRLQGRHGVSLSTYKVYSLGGSFIKISTGHPWMTQQHSRPFVLTHRFWGWVFFTRYADRQEGTGVEARAGLTLYAQVGYVGADQHTEAGSRTLDYACMWWAHGRGRSLRS